MKMISQSRAEKLAKLYEAAEVAVAVIEFGSVRSTPKAAIRDLVLAMDALDNGKRINPMQVLEGD